MRLQKRMAEAGLCSRRAAEQWILQGRVSVNGTPVLTMGQEVTPTDVISVDGKPLPVKETLHYLAYHKLPGEIATVSDPEGRPTVLSHFRNYPARLYPVGRLDWDSEGLLLLTNDGELTQRLTHPKHEMQKVYRATARGFVPDGALSRLETGVVLEDGMTAPASVRLLTRSDHETVLELTLTEGRNRQVRRMIAKVGFPVSRLMRVAMGPVHLGDLPRGGWRLLTKEELQGLQITLDGKGSQ